MRALVLLLLVSSAGGAIAAPPEPVPASPAASLAEYKRLREELDRLAKRTAWPGVERTYQDMLATGVPPQFEDLKIAAQAAYALGDVSACRSRLVAANAMREEREIVDWLWQIDQTFGRVSLAGDPGDIQLAAVLMPFDPTQSRAVTWAIEAVAATGVYEGLLPAGEYVFGTHKVKVSPGTSSGVKIDLRTDEGVRKSRKAQKKVGSADAAH